MREDLTKTNARQIRAWLALHDLKVPDLARALGCTDTTLYNYLSGRQAWPSVRARFVSLTTGVPLRALLDPRGEGAAAAASWMAEIEDRNAALAAIDNTEETS
jgi:transcriptional regulator with XRE-family HTH domain